MQKYQCKNIGSCQNADDKLIIELAAGSEARCEECGAPLTSTGDSHIASSPDSAHPPAPAWIKLAMLASGALILAGGAGYFVLGTHPASPSKLETVSAPPTPASAPKPPPPKAETLQPGTLQLTYSQAQTQAQQDCAGKAQEQGKPESAQQCLDAAKAQIAVNEAVMALQKGQLDEAGRRLEAALQFNPKDSLAHYNLAVLAAQRKDAELAARSLQAAVDNGFKQLYLAEKDPDLAPVLQHPAVRAVLDKAMKQQPSAATS